MRNNWAYIAALVSILALFSLRFYNLTILPVFADEAIYIRWSQVMRAEETLRFLPLIDGKAPLFMWVVIPFLKVFSDPLFAGRFTSVLSGFGTLIGVTYISWLLFKSKKAALAAALIYAVMPYAFFFDRMSLADSMLSMFGIWVFVFAYLAYTKLRLDFAMIAGMALGAAWLTKSPAIFFAIMLPAFWIFTEKAKNLLKIVPLTLVTIVIGYGMYNILRLGPNFHMIASRNADYIYPLSHFLTDPINPFKTFLKMSFEWIWAMGPWPVLALALSGIFINGKKNWKQEAVLFVWFLGPILVQSEFARVFTARYIFFSIPFLAIIAGSAFTGEKKNWGRIMTFAIAFFAAQAILFDYHLLTAPDKANLPRSERSGYLEEWTAGQGIYEVAGYLRTLAEKDPQAKIIAGTEGLFGTLPDGLQIYLNDKPEILVIGVDLDFTVIPKPLTDSRDFGNKTFFIVNDERYHADPQKQGLKLIATYPKAVRPDGTRQSLLLFELK